MFEPENNATIHGLTPSGPLSLRIIRDIQNPLWQASKWDRMLRSGDNYTEKWYYYENNPVRANLIESSAEWPYKGELNVFRWTGS